MNTSNSNIVQPEKPLADIYGVFSMKTKTPKDMTQTHLSPFERIKRTNDAGNEYWSSRA